MSVRIFQEKSAVSPSVAYSAKPRERREMKVLFVCTGNICRSPMGELLFPHFFHAQGIETNSAGTHGLIDSPIDPSSAKLMAQDGIDTSAFCSKRLTPQLVMDSDLILCFTKHQQKEIVQLSPRGRRKTFTVQEFAQLCTYCSANNLISGNTPENRLESILTNSTLARPMLVQVEDIADPYRKDFNAFQTAHDEMGEAFAQIAAALDVSPALHARG